MRTDRGNAVRRAAGLHQAAGSKGHQGGSSVGHQASSGGGGTRGIVPRGFADSDIPYRVCMVVDELLTKLRLYRPTVTSRPMQRFRAHFVDFSNINNHFQFIKIFSDTNYIRTGLPIITASRIPLEARDARDTLRTGFQNANHQLTRTGWRPLEHYHPWVEKEPFSCFHSRQPMGEWEGPPMGRDL